MEEPTATVLVFLLVLPLLVVLAGASVRWTPPDHVLVVSRRGVVRRVVGGGPTWRWPLLDVVEVVPLDAEPLAVTVRATTRDGHDVRLLAEASVPVEPPCPGDPADVLDRARADAEADLEDELARAVGDRDVADLGRVAVRDLQVVGLDVVLRPVP
ncbi:SPFH domain-containing protein [Nocardioides dongkuii]|uniref:SPFH domain-containing protein n=1 Tax=Nocardioides dongkuii TaxID=2760089 RepID=UPI0015F95AB3|nr:SPFH domain-containing protein [Nocardioides dongkuii]